MGWARWLKGRWPMRKTSGVISWYLGKWRTQTLKPSAPPLQPGRPLARSGSGRAPAAAESEHLGLTQELDGPLVASVPSYPEGSGGKKHSQKRS